MIQGQSLLPILSTNNINISSGRKKIEVDFSLSIVSNRSLMQNLINSRISERLYLYFVIADDNSSNIINVLSDPASRNNALEQMFVHDASQMRAKKAIKRIRLDEVINNNLNSEYALSVSDLSNERRNELRAKTIIEYDPGRAYHQMETDKLHLVCFIHTDFSGNNLPANPIFAGNLNYDLLLERNSGTLQVPEFLNLFYAHSLEEGTDLYTGPVHYHDEQTNPLPDGYVGWMAGHPDGEMGQKLQVRKVRNDKISSDFSSLLGLAADMTVGLSTMQASMLESEIDHFSNLKAFEIIKKKTEKFYSANQIKNPAILEYGNNYTNFTTIFNQSDNPSTVQDRSHHGFAMGIEFINTLKYRSRLGYLLDFHLSMQNDNFVLDCLGSSKIIDLKILRQRVTNQPEKFNEVESLKYTRFDKTKAPTKIISSGDKQGNQRFKHNLYKMRSIKGEIREVELFAPNPDSPDSGELTAPPYHVRQFIIKDYDLFHNVTFGKYEYLLDLELEDGIFKTLEKYIRRTRDVLNAYQKFLGFATIQTNRNIIDESEQTGNYDYRLDSFTDTFSQAPENLEMIETAIEIYQAIKTILTGRVNRQEVEELRLKLNLRNTKIQDVIQFQEILKDLYHGLRSLISQEDQDEFGIHGSQRASTVYSKKGNNIVKILSKIDIRKQALSPETPIADYSIEDSNMSIPVPYDRYVDMLRSPASNARIVLGRDTSSESLVIMPSSFIQVVTSPVESEMDSSEYLADKERRLYEHTLHPRPTPDLLLKVSSIEEYAKLTPSQKSNIDLKLSILTNHHRGDVLEYETNGNSEDEWPKIAQRFAGGVSVGFSKKKTDLTSSTDMIENINPEDLNIDIPENTKKALCESAFHAKDKEQFIEESEKSYKELFISKNILGVVYDFINHLSIFPKEHSTQTYHNQSFEDRYKEFTLPASISSVSSIKGIYTRNIRSLEFVRPGANPIPVKKILLSSSPKANLGSEKIERCMFIKYTSYSDATCAQAANNFVFLEI